MKLLLLATLLWAETTLKPVSLSRDAFRPLPKKINQDGYFAVAFDPEKFKAALAAAEKKEDRPLFTRGDAHMTVLTPPEFMRLSPNDRQSLLGELQSINWQKNPLVVRCVGRGEAEIKGKKERTYYVLVEASEVRRVREKFGLKEFYPHITLGFTKRDLHPEDGVIKDSSTCFCAAELLP